MAGALGRLCSRDVGWATADGSIFPTTRTNSRSGGNHREVTDDQRAEFSHADSPRKVTLLQAAGLRVARCLMGV